MALQNGREENGEWNALRLTLKKDGSDFEQFTIGACVVKVTSDIFYVLGGRVSSDGPITSKVYSINMKEQSVQEVGSLSYTRAQHACALIPSDALSRQLILVTGGVSENSSVRDEIFDVALRKSKVLDNSQIVPRINHQMVALGQKVFALGGQRQSSDDSKLDEIEVFDAILESWSLHDSTLLSEATNGIAVTEFPISSVSCNQDCACGVRPGARVVGGQEPEVSR